MSRNRSNRRRAPARHERGAATLIVVMVLFFVVSMVAAYTNRNMLFEQRTSANQYRSSQALEAAEAGVEWALSMLNHSRIDASCIASASSTDTSFRERYLAIDALAGTMLPRTTSAGAELTPQCVFDPASATWSCSCPADGAPSVTAPTAPGTAPAFAIRFLRAPEGVGPLQPGVVRIESVGCTRLSADCLQFVGQGQVNEGRAVVSVLAALAGRVNSVPVAALTSRGAVNVGGSLYNSQPGDSGVTVQAGGSVSSSIMAYTAAGSPPATSIIAGDTGLQVPAAAPYTASDRFFGSVFGIFPESFRLQQSAVRRTCAGAPCTAAVLRADILMNPGRPIWIDGNVNVNSGGDIGSVAAPVLLIVNGDLQFSVSGVTIHGLVYVRPVSPSTVWTTSGTGQVQGALVVDGDVGTSGGANFPTVVYSSAALATLRSGTGSFVRVPSSWKDYQ